MLKKNKILINKTIKIKKIVIEDDLVLEIVKHFCSNNFLILIRISILFTS